MLSAEGDGSRVKDVLDIVAAHIHVAHAQYSRY